MTKEQMYKDQLVALGVYDKVFDAAIHTLCIQERELSRTMKAWKATVPKDMAPSPLNPLYAVIQTQRRDISALRDSLGMTPKGLRKLRGRMGSENPEDTSASNGSPALSAILDGLRSKANG